MDDGQWSKIREGPNFREDPAFEIVSVRGFFQATSSGTSCSVIKASKLRFRGRRKILLRVKGALDAGLIGRHCNYILSVCLVDGLTEMHIAYSVPTVDRSDRFSIAGAV